MPSEEGNAASGLVQAIDDRHAIGWPFTYGYSVGACLAGPDLAGVELVDPPTVTVPGCPQVEPRTLRLVNFRIVPQRNRTGLVNEES